MISKNDIASKLEELEKEGHLLVWIPDLHRYEWEGGWLRLPLSFTPDLLADWEMEELPSYVIVVVQSGQACVGLVENGQLTDHKVFKSYMVRQKQGKSQLKYLKTKGKSKAGSRLRLANAEDFFAGVNERLTEYLAYYNLHKVALSCNKTILPFLLEASTPFPMDKKDDRIYKIPRHIHEASLEVLQEVHRYLEKGEIA
jgi:hypothetical protein